MQTLLRRALAGLALLALVACGAQPGATSSQGTIVTFRIADAEEYRIRLTDPADIAAARAMAAAEEGPRTPTASSSAARPTSTPATAGTSTPPRWSSST